MNILMYEFLIHKFSKNERRACDHRRPVGRNQITGCQNFIYIYNSTNNLMISSKCKLNNLFQSYISKGGGSIPYSAFRYT